MKDFKSMIKICVENISVLDAKKKDFIIGFSKKAKTRGILILTDWQAQYLQACYDIVVSKKYGVEPMSTDKEFAAKRAIRIGRAAGKIN